MRSRAIECSLAYAKKLNPAFERLDSEKQRKQAFCERATRAVRQFLYDYVRPEYPTLFPPNGIEPSSGFMTADSSDLLVVEVYLPPHKDMSGLTGSLQRLLIKKLLQEMPELQQQLTVTIGPARKAAA